MEAIMQRLMKCCARGALGLGAAALLLSGIPAHAKAVSGAPGAAFRESQPRLLAQSTAQQEEAAQLEKCRQKELQEKQEMEKQQQQQESQPKKLKTRGAIPEAAPTAPAGRGRFGAGVVRHGDPGDTKEAE
jgi:Tfp pilus assembly protein PilN